MYYRTAAAVHEADKHFKACREADTFLSLLQLAEELWALPSTATKSHSEGAPGEPEDTYTVHLESWPKDSIHFLANKST